MKESLKVHVMFCIEDGSVQVQSYVTTYVNKLVYFEYS